MVNIGDFLQPEHKKSLLQNTISRGDVFCVKLSQEDGITPKGSNIHRDKFFVILGFDDFGDAYGGVVINSNINQNVSPEIRDYHYPISAKDYQFLNKDSFVNCGSIIKADKAKLLDSKCLGNINENDLNLIYSTVCSCPIISNKEKLKYKISQQQRE